MTAAGPAGTMTVASKRSTISELIPAKHQKESSVLEKQMTRGSIEHDLGLNKVFSPILVTVAFSLYIRHGPRQYRHQAPNIAGTQLFDDCTASQYLWPGRKLQDLFDVLIGL